MFMKNRPMTAIRIGPLDRWKPRLAGSTPWPYVAAWISATTMTTAKIAVITFCAWWIHL